MSNAIKKLHDYLAKSPSVVYPQDVLAYLPAIEAENAKLREQVERLQPKDCEGNVLDIADTVSMLRSEYDGDHEWDDVVVELALTKWGGDRWIVRGSKGEAWACECTRTGHDDDAYESSSDVEPLDDATLIEVENAKLRELVKHTWLFANRAHEAAYELCPDRSDPHALATISALTLNAQDVAVRMCELGIEVDS